MKIPKIPTDNEINKGGYGKVAQATLRHLRDRLDVLLLDFKSGRLTETEQAVNLIRRDEIEGVALWAAHNLKGHNEV